MFALGLSPCGRLGGAVARWDEQGHISDARGQGAGVGGGTVVRYAGASVNKQAVATKPETEPWKSDGGGHHFRVLGQNFDLV